MTMITPSYLGETIEYSSLHACRSTLEDPTRFAGAAVVLYAKGGKVRANDIGVDPGGNAAGNGWGIRVIGADSTQIGGGFAALRNVIANSRDAGISIEGGSKHTLIAGEYIGLDALGRPAGNGRGIVVAGSDSTTIGGGPAGFRNFIANNQGIGISIEGGSKHTLVTGNSIGIDAAGRSGGNGTGIVVDGSESTTIGGAVAGFRNIIARNQGAGIVIQGGSKHTLVTGNYVGVDAAGDTAGNGTGIAIAGADSNTVGGALPLERNVISGNVHQGIVLQGGSSSNTLLGNFIGTDTLGAQKMGNGGVGVFVVAAPNNTIGGTSAAARNVIAGNTLGGITIQTSNNTRVYGNYVGVSATGVAPLGNGKVGIAVKDATATLIGALPPSTTSHAAAAAGGCGSLTPSPSSTPGNLISSNDSVGISISGKAARGTRISANYVGTDLTGLRGLGNGSDGIFVEDAPDTWIGAGAPGSGNLVSDNGRAGIHVAGTDAADAFVQGNTVGTTYDGVLPLGNGRSGIYVDGAPKVQVGGVLAILCNLVSGNGRSGALSGVIVEHAAAAGTRVQGNFVGVDRTGMKPLGNTGDGVQVKNTPDVLVGGANNPATHSMPRNIISANQQRGVSVWGDSANHVSILGNYIGPNSSGNGPVGAITTNQVAGVEVDSAPRASIGDSTQATRNVISGNDVGVFILGPPATETRVQNNYIGTTADGISALKNVDAGVVIYNAPRNHIGFPGTLPGPPFGNLIAGNDDLRWTGAVVLYGDSAFGNLVQGNLIGTQKDGKTAQPNRFNNVVIQQNANHNTIGGADSLAGNVIAFSDMNGVVINDAAGGRTVGNAILSNRIYSSGWRGINLGGDTLPLRNVRRVAAGPIKLRGAGPNMWQSSPELHLRLGKEVGTLDADTSTIFRVQFFSDSGNVSGYGEGRRLLGDTTVQTNANGFASFDLPKIPNDEVLSATATDPSGNTSEFSRLACDDSLNVSQQLRIDTVHWSNPATSQQGHAQGFNKSVVPLRFDATAVHLLIHLTIANPRPGDAVQHAFVQVRARNIFPNRQATTAAVDTEVQPFDIYGHADVTISADRILEALAAPENRNLVEATVKVCYRGRTQMAVSDNLLSVIREKTIVFLPGVLGSEISVSMNGTKTKLFPPYLPFSPWKDSIAYLAFNKTNLSPNYPASGLSLFTQYPSFTKLVKVYDIQSPFDSALARRMPRLTLTSPGAATPTTMSYYYLRAWPYDWRLRLEEHVAALAGRPTVPNPPFTSPPLKEILDSAKSLHQFHDAKLALAGHSTGGLIVRSALTATPPAHNLGSNSFADWVDRAFFINTPFLGAPKAYYTMLTGELVSGLLDESIMRSIAPNMPVMYYLAPVAGYTDTLSTPANVVMIYPGTGGTLVDSTRGPNTAAATYMDPAIAAAGQGGPWNPRLEAAADTFFSNIGTSSPVIGWQNTTVFYSVLPTNGTPGPVIVQGPGTVSFDSTSGDGTVPMLSLIGRVVKYALDSFPLSTTAPQPIPDSSMPVTVAGGPAPPPPPVQVSATDLVHDQAANSQYVWDEIIANLSAPLEKSYATQTLYKSFPESVSYVGKKPEVIGELETARLAKTFKYDSILGATASRVYRQAYDGVYCDGEIVPKLRNAVRPVSYMCDGTLVIAEAKGGYTGQSLDAIMGRGYQYRQGTIEWARKAGDSLLVAAARFVKNMPNAPQLQATRLFFDSMQQGAPVRSEVFHADFRNSVTYYYPLVTYPP